MIICNYNDTNNITINKNNTKKDTNLYQKICFFYILGC